MFCGKCGTEASKDASFCHKCGAPHVALNSGGTPVPKAAEDLQVDAVRKGIIQAKKDEETPSMLFGEVIIFAAGFGYFLKSWWVFGGLFVGLSIALAIPPLVGLTFFILSLGWGYGGYLLGEDFDSNSASYVLAALGFLFSLAVHSTIKEWMKAAVQKQRDSQKQN